MAIDAPPEAVWPWIVQMGYGRAGFYSYDLFDNAGYDSADRVLLDLQELKIGDWMPMASKVNDTTAFKVKAFKANAWLLWEKPGQHLGVEAHPARRGPDAAGRPAEGEASLELPGLALLGVFLLEVGDFPMMRKAMKGIKTRAATRTDPVLGSTCSGRARGTSGSDLLATHRSA